MSYSKVVISAGHSKKIRGAGGCGYDEHDEAVKVMNRVAQILKSQGVTVYTYEETTATNKMANLANICRYHNSKTRQLDVSIHFNAGGGTGVEVLWLSNDMKPLASLMSKNVSEALGIRDRGAKQRTDLYFLRTTKQPAILIETCFIDNKNDMEMYAKKFEAVCQAIAKSISGKVVKTQTPKVEYPKPEVKKTGKLTSAHIGVVTTTGSVNVYSKPDGLSYKRKLTKGSYKVYSVDQNTGMLCVGNSEWIGNPTKHPDAIKYTQYVLHTFGGTINIYSQPNPIAANYKGKLQVGDWKIYAIDLANSMVCIGKDMWVVFDYAYAELK